jgi:hypothetical protein
MRYGEFPKKYFHTHHLFPSGDSILVFDQPLPHSIPNCRQAASCSALRVIATAHCSDRRPPINANHRGRVRPATTRSSICWKKTAKDREHDKDYGTEAGALAGHRMRLMYFFFPTPEGGKKTTLGVELRRKEHRLSRTEVCVADREGAVDDMSEGTFCLSFLPTPARPESQRSIAQVGPTRQAQFD